MFDLRAFREKKLGLSQHRLAQLLSVRQDYISRLEQRPHEATVEFLQRLCDLSGVTPNQLLEFSFSKPQPLNVQNAYSQVEQRCSRLAEHLVDVREQIIAGLEKDPHDVVLTQASAVLSQLDQILSAATERPYVTVLGKSSAGKSRLVNALLGADILPIGATPTTAATVYIKHVEQRPPWIQEEAWVFRSPKEGEEPFDVRRSLDENYCRGRKLLGGSSSILIGCSFDGGHRDADAILLFADSPILKTCNLVDTPGIASNVPDSQDGQMGFATLGADAVIFLVDDRPDNEEAALLQSIVQNLPDISTVVHGAPILGNLLLVLSKADRFDQATLDRVRNERAMAYAQCLWDALSSRVRDGGISPEELVLQRLFTYSALDGYEDLSVQFNARLERLVVDELPVPRLRAIDSAFSSWKAESRTAFEEVIFKCKNSLERQTGTPVSTLQMKDAESALVRAIHFLNDRDQREFIAWFRRAVDPDRIEEIIEASGRSKNLATGVVLRQISSDSYSTLRRVLNKSTEEFQRNIQAYLRQVTAGLDTMPGISVRRILNDITHELRRLPSLGAFQVSQPFGQGWTTSTNLAVSSGGPEGGAIGAVLAIGASTLLLGAFTPLGLAALVGGAASLAKWLAGPRWETTLARRLSDYLRASPAESEYVKVIDTYWRNTEAACDKMRVMIQNEIHTAAQRVRFEESRSSSEIEGMVSRAERLRDFFGGLQWGAVV
ncbi:MAG TPA: dynamin family protein [Symbiobacteriaceae bacterium]|nr:dynamin family protein [Symbiobacteriaceae bacterium]